MHNYGTSDKFLKEPLEQRHYSASSKLRNLFNDRMAIGLAGFYWTGEEWSRKAG
jgi:hypothetical protein